MNREILCGDVLDKLKEIPDESIDCIISSPPYWGLRDYGTGKWIGGDPNCDHSSIRRKTRKERGGLSDLQAGNEGGFGDESKWKSKICPSCNAKYEDDQMGLEPDFRDYLKKMSLIMDQLKRVLKKTGTCWINLGDCYGSHRSNEESMKIGFEKQERNPIKGYTKSRIGIPERFYINCIDSGWIARNHIPWYKANSMPSSVKDRFTNKWESIFFFAKNQKYYFNLDAVRVAPVSSQLKKPRNKKIDRKWKDVAGQSTQGIHRNRSEGKADWKVYLDNDSSKYNKEQQSNGQRLGKFRNNERYTNETLGHRNGLGKSTLDNRTKYGEHNRNPQPNDRNHMDYGKALHDRIKAEGGSESHPKGKNPGDVFFINPRPFPQAHFATFPVDLPLKILKCACPNQVCSKCGEYRYPIKKVIGHQITNRMKIAGCNIDGMYEGESTKDYKSSKAQNASNSKRSILESMSKVEKITGYTKCNCNESFKPGIVLDPFFGAGTTAVAAEELGLNWIGIELNEEYIKLARKRLQKYNLQRLEEFQTL